MSADTDQGPTVGGTVGPTEGSPGRAGSKHDYHPCSTGISLGARTIGRGTYILRAMQETVVGARHHNRLVGSISRSVANHPLCPVVIVPAPRDQ